MELIKKNIHMDRIKCKASTQITMEDDINITDSRPDVYQLIEEQGEVVIDEIRAVQDHVYIKGKLEFCVLYLSDDDVRRPASMEGSIPFDEQIYMEGVVPTDSVSVKKGSGGFKCRHDKLQKAERAGTDPAGALCGRAL